MADERLNNSLAENVITLLAHDDKHGKIVAALVNPNLFEGEYRTIAERCIEYWRVHGMAPKMHTPDLVSDILEDPGNRKAQTYRRILTAMVNLAEGINTEYVVEKLRKFTRLQRLKDAILKSAEQLHTQQELAIEGVEEIWNEMLRARDIELEPGMRLHDTQRLLEYLDQHYSEFMTGIRELDAGNIVPYRGAVLLFLAATGRGKSWFLVNTGKHAFLQRKKVLHISLEMSEEECAQRYYQALFSIPKRQSDVDVTTFLFDDDEKLNGFDTETVVPDFAFDSRYISDELRTRVDQFSGRFENIIIKRFPPQTLTPSGLRAYLDTLEIAIGFVPDLLIVDYVGIMKTDANNHRISIGMNMLELRGIAIERNMACATAGQLSRAGANASTPTLTHVAEDWTLINTADIAVVYASTDAEFRNGLGRLYVGKARSEQDRWGLIITQNYAIGQFCLDSARLSKRYFEKLEALKEDDETPSEEDDDES